MEELKPCPLCGGEAEQRDFTEPFVNGWVGCQKCHCFINWVKGGKPEAVAVWNRRIAPESKPLTNAGRIRSMSNEELAVTLMCPNDMGMAEIECDRSDNKNCCQCLLNWLNQLESPE